MVTSRSQHVSPHRQQLPLLYIITQFNQHKLVHLTFLPFCNNTCFVLHVHKQVKSFLYFENRPRYFTRLLSNVCCFSGILTEIGCVFGYHPCSDQAPCVTRHVPVSIDCCQTACMTLPSPNFTQICPIHLLFAPIALGFSQYIIRMQKVIIDIFCFCFLLETCLVIWFSIQVHCIHGKHLLLSCAFSQSTCAHLTLTLTSQSNALTTVEHCWLQSSANVNIIYKYAYKLHITYPISSY